MRRDYPSVPNVFRVASTHSINNDAGHTPATTEGTKIAAPTTTAATTATNTKLNTNVNRAGGVIISGRHGGGSGFGAQTNLNARGNHHQHQQHQHQQQHSTAKVISATTTSTTALTTTATTTGLRTGHAHAPTAPQHNIHRLTTTASIERNYQSSIDVDGGHDNDDTERQCSAYGIVQPTPPPPSARSISLAMGNGDVRHQYQQHRHYQQQQQQHQQQLPCNGRSVGVINTISGSIPSTGFTTTNGNGNGNGTGNDGEGGGCSGGYTSERGDFIQVLPNFATDSRKVNGTAARVLATSKPDGISSSASSNAKATTESTMTTTRGRRHTNECPTFERGGYLSMLTPVAASISVAIVIAALAGPQWLFTEEKFPNPKYNGSANYNAPDDGVYVTKFTKSSLWILCTTMQDNDSYKCIKIDYFPTEDYRPDPMDSTPAIPYTVTKSCPLFLASGVFLLASFFVFLIPTCSHQSNLYYFSAGIMFIVSGLLMFIGLISYISILKSEIGSKLRPRSPLQPALFKFSYGQSFFLYVCGFIATEFVGLLNIFLFIHLQELNGYYTRLPCMPISNFSLQFKGNGHIDAHQGTYKSFARPLERKPPIQSRSPHCHNNRHQVYTVQLPPEIDDKDSGKQYNHHKQQRLPPLSHQQMSKFPCRKHPNSRESSVESAGPVGYYEDAEKERRLHQRNLARSLSDLYSGPEPQQQTVMASAALPSALKTQTMPRLQHPTSIFGDLPQEFPLTRSTSTLTDIYSSNNGNANANLNLRHMGPTPLVERRQKKRNMATNTRRRRPNDTEMMRGDGEVESKSEMRRRENECDDFYDDDGADDDDDENEGRQRLCGLKRATRKSKDELFEEFCKRAGVRPKPKNIYYIASEEEEQRLRRCKRLQHRHGSEEDDDKGPVAGVGMERRSREYDDKEQHFIVEDSPAYQSSQLRNAQRTSAFAESAPIRRLNSNLSLHTFYRLPDKLPPTMTHPCEMERCDSTSDMWPPTHPESSAYYARNAYGGSQNRLHQEQLYQSRTLPRSFLKSNTNSLDSLGSLRASASALHSAYGGSQNRLALVGTMQQQQHQHQHQHQQQQFQLMHQQQFQHQQQQRRQQQQQQQHRFLPLSHEAGIHHSALSLHKSCENIAMADSNDNNIIPPPPQHQQPQQQQSGSGGASTIYASIVHPGHTTQQMQLQQSLPCASVNHNGMVVGVSAPASKANSSISAGNSNSLQASLVQWPAAIPSSPAHFPTKLQIYPPAANTHPSTPPNVRSLMNRSVSSASSASGGCIVGPPPPLNFLPSGPPKFQRAYAFDEQRRASGCTIASDVPFDLDEIERERRRSHASLMSGSSSSHVASLGVGMSGMGNSSSIGSSNNNQNNNSNDSRVEQYDMINGTAV